MNTFAVMKYRVLLILPFFYASGTMAGEWSLGAAAGVGVSPYRDTDNNVTALPLIGYEGEDFYLHGLAGGYHLWKDENNQLNILGYYSPMHFKPGDSDDEQMKRLDKRYSTVLAGFEYTHYAFGGEIRALFAGDILNNSNGLTGDLAYRYPIHLNDWEITPMAGVRWDSKNQNKYYYGVSSSESRRSGLASYTPDDSFTPYIELAVRYHINQNWDTVVSGRFESLASTVQDSPMVERSNTGSVSFGVNYSF
ncbi:MipA/OmpV family protein [Acerihabitans arboris]|uniref:MipA/OmpV family protein n=1 Tax=Acerihabitans arboris TaxID=2691583 RepID=A0A845SMD4_9GAMM|nr:MipA/OmpV family protein [Acerihabitans arboris]NDL66080.1 MipA/OmpV family protein [Acerihabitans arboris]